MRLIQPGPLQADSLKLVDLPLPQPGEGQVRLRVRMCGVCHTDLHTVEGDIHPPHLPLTPGHQVVGIVEALGSVVSGIHLGDRVGVPWLHQACGECQFCRRGLENLCPNAQFTGFHVDGGYAEFMLAQAGYVLPLPAAIPDEQAAPLLCAGITTWSPLRKWEVGPGQTVGVVGLGGLGHMGVKLARALGANVVLFTTSPGKAADAIKLGANEVVISTDRKAMAEQRNRFDFILNTVAAPHDLDPFLGMLKRDGSLVLVGAPSSPHPSPGVFNLIFKRRSLAGSLIGGIAETQEMLDFCAEHGIVSDIEMIPIASINDAYERMLKSDVKYRFVIDMATL